MKIKLMTDLEISSFNTTVDKLLTGIKSLRDVYQAVKEDVDELKTVIDTIEIEVDDNIEESIEENFELIRTLYDVCDDVEQPLTDLEEVIDKLEWVEENDDDDDE